MVNLRISLSPKVADALASLAYSELRDPRDQAVFLLQQSLERLGLLVVPQTMVQSAQGGKDERK